MLNTDRYLISCALQFTETSKEAGSLGDAMW